MEKNAKSSESSEGEERRIIEDPEEDIGIYLREGEYNVEKILDMKIKNGKKHFFVKWEGYNSNQNTWEPAEHLKNIAPMIREFEIEYARKNKQRQQSKKTDSIASKPKDGVGKKHRATTTLQEETIVKKTKFNTKEGNADEENGQNIQNSPNSDRASNFEFDFSDDDKAKPEENKNNASGAKKDTPNKSVKNELKPIKAVKMAGKESQPKKPMIVKKRDKLGGFRNRDKPKQILGIKPGKNNEFFFLVEWEKRSDGVKPENSHVSNEEFRTYDSNFLLDFYESKIVIFARKQGLEMSNKKAEKQAQETNGDLQLTQQKTPVNISPSKVQSTPLANAKNINVNGNASSNTNGNANGNVNGNDHGIGKVGVSQPAEKTLEDMARDLDFQAMEDPDGNFMNFEGDGEQ